MKRPIPRNDLIHSCNYNSVTLDEYGNEETSLITDLKFIRFEPKKATNYGSNGEEKKDKLMMFYDCQNSRPKDFTFNELDRLTFEGNEYTVREVNKLYDGTRLHHYEINLV